MVKDVLLGIQTATTEILVLFFGKLWFLFSTLLLLNVLDIITGVLSARITGKVSSAIGTKGLFKKMAMWVSIIVAFALSATIARGGHLFGISIPELDGIGGWLVVIYCIMIEAISIFENIDKIDQSNPLPRWIKSLLEVIKRLITKKANAILHRVQDPEMIEQDICNQQKETDERKEEVENNGTNKTTTSSKGRNKSTK